MSDADGLRAALAAIPDPEIPVITVAELGILREVDVEEADGVRTAHVVITPTYSGCPAMRQIEDTVRATCARHGFEAQVVTRLEPAWTTDWMSDDARERLRRFGIAPPGERPVGQTLLTLARRTVTCPLCGSDATEEVSHFGSTACKSLRRCTACGEPFDEFKAI